MVNDMTWRKFPRELLTNDSMAYIAEQFPSELRAAPYMFYVTALCKADDDGIFDIEDGIMFARAMKIGTINDVAKIANYMQKMHIITRVSAKSNKCILIDWDYPKTAKSRTMAERRQIVMKQIEEAEAKKKATTYLTAADLQQAGQDDPSIEINLSDHTSSDLFLCPVNDKKRENVVIERIDDNSGENVERTEREIRQDKIDKLDKTHTQEAPDFRGPLEGPLQSSAETSAVAGEFKNTENKNDQMESSDDIPDAVNVLVDAFDGQIIETAEEHTAAEINRFFVKNCYGYSPKQARHSVMELVKRFQQLATDTNPAEVIANVFMNEFKKMSETPGQHWYGTPLLPAYLAKEGVYSHVMARASRILLSNDAEKDRWRKQMEIYKADYEKERAEVCDGIDQEYLKYNIDPADPQRAAKLLAAKAAGGKAKE